jgi:hypothetical protein
MNEWNITSRAHACQACGKAFVDQQGYHTLLVDERQEFRRQDVCEACWRSQFSEGARDRKGFVSCWQGVYEAPPAAPPEAIRKETAETVLRRLIEQNEPQHLAATYILAVMLERKRLLKIKEQHYRDGQRIFVYEQPKTGDVFTIPDPGLQLDQLQQVQHDVALLLEPTLAPPVSPAPSASGPGADAGRTDEPLAESASELAADAPADAPTPIVAP